MAPTVQSLVRHVRTVWAGPGVAKLAAGVTAARQFPLADLHAEVLLVGAAHVAALVLAAGELFLAAFEASRWIGGGDALR